MRWIDAIKDYQTLIFGIIGILLVLMQICIAYSQKGIAARQAEISGRQLSLAEHGQRERQAQAIISIDATIVPMFQMYDATISAGLHRDVGLGPDGVFHRFEFDPSVLLRLSGFLIDTDIAKLSTAAVTAFPEQAPDLVQAFKAALDVKALAADYSARPWDKGDQRIVHANDALNRFFIYCNKSGKVQPHARAVK